MVKFDDVTEENRKNHNPNWPQILPNHPYRIKIILYQEDFETNLDYDFFIFLL